MDDKIVLDGKSFEALASKTRVQILKSLKERRKTLTELSSENSLSISGTKEHLDNLEKAELIKKMDDGHKWKYYQLTNKGVAIVSPNLAKVYVLLAVSLSIFLYSLFIFYSPVGNATTSQLIPDGVQEKTMLTSGSANSTFSNMLTVNSLDNESRQSFSNYLNETQNPGSDNSASELFTIAILAASSLISISCVLYIILTNFGLFEKSAYGKN